MKNICFFSGDITRSGGTERVASLIANGLLQTRNPCDLPPQYAESPDEFHITFVSLTEQAPKPFFYLDKRIRHYALNDKWLNPGPGYLKIIPRLRRFLKEHDIDILIDIDIVLDILSIPAARGLKTRVISWEHSNYHYESSVFYRRMILKYSVKRSDYIVTLTERDRECYQTSLNRTSNIQCIYNPITTADAPPDLPKQKWILSVGNLVRIKGPDYLLKTADIVLKKHPDWSWLVLGDGDQRSEMEDFIKKHQLENHLILKGRVKDVPAYLAQAQIFVLTSRSEGLPMCLLEAREQSLPCVSFDIRTGPAEIIEDQRNGYLIPPYSCEDMAEKICLLIENEELRQQFSSQASCGIEKFHEDRILHQWKQVFRELCV